MAFGKTTADKVGEGVDVTSVDAVEEEGCAGVMSGEAVQHLGSIDVRAIIKREGNCSRHSAVRDHGAERELGGSSCNGRVV